MNSLIVKRFKNIRALHLSGLHNVNLIVGQNNVGKSTLLEAISLYLTQGAPSHLHQLLERRGELMARQEETDEERKSHFLSLFYGYKESYRKDDYIFVGQGEEDPFAVKLNQVYIKENIEKDDDGNERRIRSRLFEEDLLDNDSILEPGISVMSSSPALQSYSGMVRRIWMFRDPIIPFQYVDAHICDAEQNASLFDRISLSPDEGYVVETLQIINPLIERIAYVTSSNKRDRYPIVTIQGDTRRYRLSSMGDGINRILTIILSMLNCKNGVLLIDEFETGLHYSVQEQLWSIVFSLSKKLNIQVFATSHSRDCIEGFARQNAKDDGLLVRLEQRGEEILPVLYADKREILFAIKNEIEIR